MELEDAMDKSFSGIGRVLSWIITALLWAILCTPLIISKETLYPFQTGKGVVFRVLIEISAFLYSWLVLIEPRVRPKLNKFFWSVIFFGIVLLLTMATGIDPQHSFWGDLERMEGVFGILHAVILFVIVYGMFTSRIDWTRFFAISLFVSFFVALYAFAQINSFFRFFQVAEITDVRPGSTLGHPSFVATYAIFQIFFGVFIVLLEKSIHWRIFGASFSMLNLILLTLTATRGAQIALLIAMLVGIIVTLLFVSTNLRVRIILSAALIIPVALFVGVIAFKDSPQLLKLPYAFQRMSTISFDTPTARTRLISLRISWNAFKENPILGWGQENFKTAYNKHFDPEHLTFEQSWFDRAHNKVAEVAVNSGAVGLTGYLAIFVIGFLGMVHFLKTNNRFSEKVLAVSVIMLGTAYFVQNLFLFDMTSSYILFFSSLAFTGFFLTGGRSFSTIKKNEQTSKLQKKMNSRNRFLIFMIGIIMLFALVWGNWVPYTTASFGKKSIEGNLPAQTLAFYSKALESGGFPTTEVTRAMMEALLNSKRTETKEWSEVFMRICNDAESVSTDEYPNLQNLIILGKLYNERSLIEPQYLSKAERVLNRAIVLSPKRQEAYYELGVTYLRKNQGMIGLQYFRDALVLNKNNSRAHWVLGLALASQNYTEEGLTELETALTSGYNWDNPADINNLTTIYTFMNQNERLARFYEHVIEKHPANAHYRVTLAAAYAKIGSTDKAKEHILKAVQLDRRYEDHATQFIQNHGL